MALFHLGIYLLDFPRRWEYSCLKRNIGYLKMAIMCVCVCACFFAIVIFAPKEIVILVQNIGDQTALTKGDLPIYWHR